MLKAIRFDTYEDLLDAYEAQDGRAGYHVGTERWSHQFWVLLPTGVMSRLNLGASGWQLEEHEDGAVTITPSIWNQTPPGAWHGFLTRDEFVSC